MSLILAAQGTAASAAAAAKPVLDDPDTEATPGIIEKSAATTGTTGNGDFRSAFNAWKGMDNGTDTDAATLSMPSAKPLSAMSMSSKYGMRVHPVTGRLARHNGIDLPAPAGTPIYATADGVVGRAQRLGNYGNYVEIEHGSAVQTRYGHMQSFVVASGQRVKKGDIIGYVGSTGRSTGNHLHYEIRVAGAPVNPLTFIRQGQELATLKGEGAMGGPE